MIPLVQEGRADWALVALEQFSAPEASVQRGVVARRVPASRLVAGDVVLIEPGDLFAGVDEGYMASPAQVVEHSVVFADVDVLLLLAAAVLAFIVVVGLRVSRSDQT